MKQWIKTKLVEDAYLPIYSAMFFIIAIFLDMAGKNIVMTTGLGFIAIILLMVKIIDRLNDIRALLLFILKEQDGTTLIMERKEDAKEQPYVKVRVKRAEDDE